MVKTVTPGLAGAYAVLATFTFCSTWHVKHFRGASRVFEVVLIYFATAATIIQYGTLILVGIKWSWLAAALLLGIAVASLILSIVVEVLLRRFVHRDIPYFLSLAGFVAIPTAIAYLYINRP